MPVTAPRPSHRADRHAADAGGGAETPAGHLRCAALGDVLGYRLAQAAVATTRVFDERVGRVHALRPVEYTLLQLVVANPGASPVRLAKALALAKPQVTLRMDTLVERGLVQRRPSASDGRAQELHATAAGQRLAAQCTAALHDGEAAALGTALTAAERAMLIELLDKAARGGR